MSVDTANKIILKTSQELNKELLDSVKNSCLKESKTLAIWPLARVAARPLMCAFRGAKNSSNVKSGVVGTIEDNCVDPVSCLKTFSAVQCSAA